MVFRYQQRSAGEPLPRDCRPQRQSALSGVSGWTLAVAPSGALSVGLARFLSAAASDPGAAGSDRPARPLPVGDATSPAAKNTTPPDGVTRRSHRARYRPPLPPRSALCTQRGTGAEPPAPAPRDRRALDPACRPAPARPQAELHSGSALLPFRLLLSSQCSLSSSLPPGILH